MEKIKVLFIYTLKETDVYDDVFIDIALEKFKVDFVIISSADNQLEHVQYPYYTIEIFE